MNVIRLNGLSMGGTWSAVLPSHSDAGNCRALIQSSLDRIEDQMSAWRPKSTLNQINSAPLGMWVDLPTESAAVIGAGLGLMDEMPGVFSILMGGASAREGFIPGRVCQVGADSSSVEFDGHRLRRHEDVAVDLNAIAKGYAADLAVETLRRNNVTNYLVEVAGDMRCDSTHPNGDPWSVAMELPLPDRTVVAQRIPLVDEAVATSGGYRRSINERSHLIAPNGAQPLTACKTSVTVIAETAMQADGWATALSILGPEAGLAQAERRGLAVAYIEATPEDGFIERGSTRMAERIS